MFSSYYRPGVNKKFIAIVIGVILLSAVSYALIKNYLVKREINTEIKSIEDQISSLKTENVQLQDLIKYFDSSAYAEQKARAEMSLQKQGESVVVITETTPVQSVPTPNSLARFEDSNPVKWFKYLFVKQ